MDLSLSETNCRWVAVLLFPSWRKRLQERFLDDETEKQLDHELLERGITQGRKF
jgi:hypothetical protein